MHGTSVQVPEEEGTGYPILKLELQTVESHLTWVLGPELRPPEDQQALLTAEYLSSHRTRSLKGLFFFFFFFHEEAKL